MSRAVRRVRARRRDEGWTLIELMVSMSIFIALLTIVFSLLVTMSQQTADNMSRAQQVAEVRLGLSQIDRQVRSGNVISDPGVADVNSGVPAYYSLRVYTQTDGTNQCVQWRVIFPPGQPTTGGELQFRSWQTDWLSTGVVTAWRVVARDLVAPMTPTYVPPFQRSVAAASSIAQSVQVTLWVKEPGSRSASAPTVITSVLTGRNTIFGYPADECAAVPTP